MSKTLKKTGFNSSLQSGSFHQHNEQMACSPVQNEETRLKEKSEFLWISSVLKHLTTTRPTPEFLRLALWQRSQNDVSYTMWPWISCAHCVLCFVLATSEVWGPTSQYLSFPVVLWVITLKRTFDDLSNNSTRVYKIRLQIGIYAPRWTMQPRKLFQYLLDCFVLTN